MEIWRYNVWWIRWTSQPSCNGFCFVIKQICTLVLYWWKIIYFLLTHFGWFHKVLLSVGQPERNACWILVFQEAFMMEDSHPVPTYTASLLWMKTGLWWSWWWFILLAHNLFCSTLLYGVYFSLPITIYFKNRKFLLCFSRIACGNMVKVFSASLM